MFVKNLKKITAVFVVGMIALSVCGCAKTYVPYEFDLAKYVTVGEYKGLTYTYEGSGVSDEMLENAINSDLKEHGYGNDKTETSGTVELGDTVTIDMTGKFEGKDDAALAAQNVEIEVGAGKFLDEFESKIVGQNIGEKCDIEVTFPEDYIKLKYAEKTVVFTVDIRSAVRKSYPDLSDSLVAEISEFKTVEEYTANITEQVNKASLADADAAKEAELWGKVVAQSEVKEYPKDAIEYVSNKLKNQFKDAADRQNQKLADYLAENDISSDEYEDYLVRRSQTLCKEEMVMNYIARVEKLKVSDDEIEALAAKYRDSYGYKDLKDVYADYDKEQIKQTILFQKVKDIIVNSAKQQ